MVKENQGHKAKQATAKEKVPKAAPAIAPPPREQKKAKANEPPQVYVSLSNKAPAPPRPGQSGKSAGKQKDCAFFKLGTCRFGEDCRDRHKGARTASPASNKGKGRKGGTGNGKGRGAGKPPAAAAAAAVSILRTPARMIVPGSVALAATTRTYDGCRSWLLDTGCRYDLTTRDSVPEMNNI